MVLASVYAVPDTVVGDQVMATVLLRPGATFDPEGFAQFLADEADLGTKWSPRYVRVTDDLPTPPPPRCSSGCCATRAGSTDPVWWRPIKDGPYRRLEEADADDLDRAVAQR